MLKPLQETYLRGIRTPYRDLGKKQSRRHGDPVRGAREAPSVSVESRSRTNRCAGRAVSARSNQPGPEGQRYNMVAVRAGKNSLMHRRMSAESSTMRIFIIFATIVARPALPGYGKTLLRGVTVNSYATRGKPLWGKYSVFSIQYNPHVLRSRSEH